jgi:hypothetical protein
MGLRSSMQPTKQNTKVSNGKVQSPRPESVEMSKLRVRTLPMCFSDIKGISNTNLFLQNKHLTKYSTFNFWNIYGSTCQNWAVLWLDKWISHDNAPSHTALSVN